MNYTLERDVRELQLLHLTFDTQLDYTLEREVRELQQMLDKIYM